MIGVFAPAGKPSRTKPGKGGSVIDRVLQLSRTAAHVEQAIRDKLIDLRQYSSFKRRSADRPVPRLPDGRGPSQRNVLIEQRQYITEYVQDPPEIRDRAGSESERTGPRH